MGLHQWLTKSYYIGGEFAENKDTEIEFDVERLSGRVLHKSFKLGNIKSVSVLVGEWNKAYAIDEWFCENFEGVEQGNLIYVPKCKLEELLNICKQISEDKELADELLPSERYDDWYYEDVEYTKGMLERILESDDGDGDFYYQIG